MGCTVVLGLVCSIRPSPRTAECLSVSTDEDDQGEAKNGVGGGGGDTEEGGAAVRVKKTSVGMIDPRLLHPAARNFWCRCCSERRDKGGQAVR